MKRGLDYFYKPKSTKYNPSIHDKEKQIETLNKKREPYMNQPVLTYQSIIQMAYNIQQRYNLSDSKMIRHQFLYDFVNLVLLDKDHLGYNEGLNNKYSIITTPPYVKYEGYVYFKGDIENANFAISIKKYYDLVQDILGVDKIDNYMDKVLLNAIIESTRYFFESTNVSSLGGLDGIVIYTNSSAFMETNQVGFFFYYLYFVEKYKSLICFPFVTTIEPFVKFCKSYHQKILQIYDGNKNINIRGQKELLDAYEWYIDPTLNCNYYVWKLMIAAIKAVESDYRLVFILSSNEEKHKFDLSTEKRVKYSKEFLSSIDECVVSKNKYILIPLSIHNEGDNAGHQNIFLVDVENGVVEQFEPHGSQYLLDNYKELYSYFNEFFKNFGFQFKSPSCSYFGIQTDIEIKDLPLPYQNKCVNHSFGYIEYRLKKGNSAPIHYYEDAKKRGFLYLDDLVQKNNQIFNYEQKDLDKINETFSSSLKFINGSMTFENSRCLSSKRRRSNS